MTIEEFKQYFPIDRIYEVPLTDDAMSERRGFEIAETWIVNMTCIGIDRERGIAKYKRPRMSFGNEMI